MPLESPLSCLVSPALPDSAKVRRLPSFLYSHPHPPNLLSGSPTCPKQPHSGTSLCIPNISCTRLYPSPFASTWQRGVLFLENGNISTVILPPALYRTLRPLLTLFTSSAIGPGRLFLSRTTVFLFLSPFLPPTCLVTLQKLLNSSLSLPAQVPHVLYVKFLG